LETYLAEGHAIKRRLGGHPPASRTLRDSHRLQLELYATLLQVLLSSATVKCCLGLSTQIRLIPGDQGIRRSLRGPTKDHNQLHSVYSPFISPSGRCQCFQVYTSRSWRHAAVQSAPPVFILCTQSWACTCGIFPQPGLSNNLIVCCAYCICMCSLVSQGLKACDAKLSNGADKHLDYLMQAQKKQCPLSAEGRRREDVKVNCRTLAQFLRHSRQATD
jgi:hypothetical protein